MQVYLCDIKITSMGASERKLHGKVEASLGTNELLDTLAAEHTAVQPQIIVFCASIRTAQIEAWLSEP